MLGVVVTAAILLVATACPAPADPPEFDPGTGIPTVGDFNPVALNGADQLTSATITPFVVTDTSGTLAGWHVSLQVPDLLNGTGPDCSTGATALIAGANISMDPPLVTAGDITTTMTGVTSAGFTDFTTARTIISAAIGDGAGTYDVSPAILRMVVPQDALAGAYCTEATLAITSGP